MNGVVGRTLGLKRRTFSREGISLRGMSRSTVSAFAPHVTAKRTINPLNLSNSLKIIWGKTSMKNSATKPKSGSKKRRPIFTPPPVGKYAMENPRMSDETPLYILIIGMIAGIILAMTLRWVI